MQIFNTNLANKFFHLIFKSYVLRTILEKDLKRYSEVEMQMTQKWKTDQSWDEQLHSVFFPPQSLSQPSLFHFHSFKNAIQWYLAPFLFTLGIFSRILFPTVIKFPFYTCRLLPVSQQLWKWPILPTVVLSESYHFYS